MKKEESHEFQIAVIRLVSTVHTISGGPRGGMDLPPKYQDGTPPQISEVLFK